LKFCTHLDRYSFQYANFLLGGMRGRSVHSVNLGPPHTLETVRARKLKFYTHLEGQVHFLKMNIFSLEGVQHPLV